MQYLLAEFFCRVISLVLHGFQNYNVLRFACVIIVVRFIALHNCVHKCDGFSEC